MKKKLSMLLCLILVATLLIGCNSAPPVLSFDSDKPWGGMNAYEKSTYLVEVIERKDSNGQIVDGKVVASGTLSFELSEEREGMLDYVTVVTDFDVKYVDEEIAGENRNLTDTIKSMVKFIKAGAVPVYSEKTANFAPRKDANGKYKDTYSYKYTADYTAKKAYSYKNQTVDKDSGAIITTDGEYADAKEFTLSASGDNIFDNEQMFFAVRALSNATPGLSQTLNISNIYEIASSITSKGKYSTTPFAAAFGAELSPITLEGNYLQNYTVGTENSSIVNCMKTTLTRGDNYPGPPITLYVTEPETIFTHNQTASKTRKIIAKMVTVEYDLQKNKEAFNTVYTLTDYTTVKA